MSALTREKIQDGIADTSNEKSVVKPYVMSHGTMEVYSLKESRKFYEEFLGLECVRHAKPAMVVRCGLNAGYGPFLALASELQRGRAAAAGLGLMFTVMAMGGFAGPATMGVLRQATGSYSAGMLVLGAALLVFTAPVLVAWRRSPKISAPQPVCTTAH